MGGKLKSLLCFLIPSEQTVAAKNAFTTHVWTSPVSLFAFVTKISSGREKCTAVVVVLSDAADQLQSASFPKGILLYLNQIVEGVYVFLSSPYV